MSFSLLPSPPFLGFFFFFKQKTAYEISWCLEFRRLLFRSRRPRLNLARVDLFDSPAALADQMVMVNGSAEAEQRLAALAPEDVDLPRVDQALKCPVDGGQAHSSVELRVEVLGRQWLRRPPQRTQHGRALPGAPCMV